jgi:Asp-tRNA(Asn)/Glu-tRNA(Gln) amidotransferase A subunit family amidase
MNPEQKLCHLSVKELSEKIENLEISPVEVVESCLIRIKKLVRLYNTFISIANEMIYMKPLETQKEKISSDATEARFMEYHSLSKIIFL